MRSKNWEWYNYFFASLIFSLGVLFLIKPFFNLFYGEKTAYLSINQNLYFLFNIIFASVIAKIISTFKKVKLRFLCLIVFVVMNILLINYFNWSIRYFIILFLIALTFGLRFEMYFGGSSFNSDFAIAVLLLLWTVLLNNNYSLGVRFFDISLIFISGISLSIFFNFDSVANKGKFKIIFMAIILTALSSFILVFLAPTTSTFINEISSYLIMAYYKIVDIFIFIIYPLIWLMGPIHKFLMYIINKFSNDGIEAPESTGNSAALEEIIKEAQKNENLSTEVNLWWFYLILALLIIYLTFKLWKITNDDNKEGVSEVRESLFTANALKNDVMQFVNNIKTTFRSNKEAKLYDQSSAEIIIREIYYNFLLYFNKYKSYHRSDTPNNYKNIIIRNKYLVNRKYHIESLTELYNNARYNKKVSRKDAEKAKKLWKEIQEE